MDWCQSLAMAFVSPRKRIKFLTFATCHSAEVAKDVLTVNGGDKLRLLAYGSEVVGGNKDVPSGSYGFRGFK